MTAEVLDYRIKQIKHITGVDILDDKSLDEALFKLIRIYSNFKKENMEIRAKAIDEFAEMLKEKYEEHNLDLCLRQNDYYSYANSCIQLENYIDKIAGQMKAGADNE